MTFSAPTRSFPGTPWSRRPDDILGTHRVAFGFTNFRNYRVRALLYAGKPDWSLLASISPT